MNHDATLERPWNGADRRDQPFRRQSIRIKHRDATVSGQRAHCARIDELGCQINQRRNAPRQLTNPQTASHDQATIDGIPGRLTDNARPQFPHDAGRDQVRQQQGVAPRRTSAVIAFSQDFSLPQAIGGRDEKEGNRGPNQQPKRPATNRETRQARAKEKICGTVKCIGFQCMGSLKLQVSLISASHDGDSVFVVASRESLLTIAGQLRTLRAISLTQQPLALCKKEEFTEEKRIFAAWVAKRARCRSSYQSRVALVNESGWICKPTTRPCGPFPRNPPPIFVRTFAP